MPATTLLPLVQSIEEVLADGHGTARVLAAADRFRMSFFEGEPKGHSAIEARVNKTAFVYVSDMRARKDSQEMSTVAHYDVTVTILAAYYLGHEGVSGENRAALAAASLDYHKVRAALCYPGNLRLTMVGAVETGLAGGMLIAPGSRWGAVLDHENRLLRATFTFPGIVILTMPS